MIDYIDRLLQHWAQELAAESTGRGFGAGSSWPFHGKPIDDEERAEFWVKHDRLTAHGKQSRAGAPSSGLGQIAEAVDRAVQDLPGQQRRAIYMHYRYPGRTVEEKASFLGCNRANFWRLINRAHIRISNYLPDSYARIAY
jgi:DNA-directed RNA polymerase specialized sigma24 family protein